MKASSAASNMTNTKAASVKEQAATFPKIETTTQAKAFEGTKHPYSEKNEPKRI